MEKLWYLSPSSQYRNVGIGDYGTEADQMNLLMDEIVKHLDNCGVSFHRADREMDIDEKVAQANSMGADWYFALHSNAGGNGQAWGPIAFHDGSTKDLGEEIVANLLATGQKNNRAYNVTDGMSLYEVNSPVGNALLLEVDFHDSEVGVAYITGSRSEAARAIAKAIVAADGKQWTEGSGVGQPSEWAREDVEKAVELGLFVGNGNGDFRWQAPVTREELAAVLMRLNRIMAGEEAQA